MFPPSLLQGAAGSSLHWRSGLVRVAHCAGAAAQGLAVPLPPRREEPLPWVWPVLLVLWGWSLSWQRWEELVCCRQSWQGLGGRSSS